jgi:GTP cyclohydrolase I
MDTVMPGWKEDPNCQDTPTRVAKMFINELQAGVFNMPPKITVFSNDHKYDGIIFEGNIDVKSMCSHHHMPFFGVAHVGYIPNPNGKYIGLSKLNRLVDYYARRANVQEDLTMQIHNGIAKLIGDNLGIAVVISAKHTCVSHRGAKNESTMKTSKLSGLFFSNEIGTRAEFYHLINGGM